MDHTLAYGHDFKYVPATSVRSGVGSEVRADVYCHAMQIVNFVLVGRPQSRSFVIIDTGMPSTTNKLIEVCALRFGAGSRPDAILLTHGHFDHVGTVIDLVRHWDVPVYAHEQEMPYLTGQEAYPMPDAGVEGGLIAKASPLFPVQPVNLGTYIHALPAGGMVPFLPDFRWIHTPGHAPGHVSFFRDADRTLIAGDAFVTVRQDSLYKVLVQKTEVHGPPRYLTTDWLAAWSSVRKLHALEPETAITGHGEPVMGSMLKEGLDNLVEKFDEVAIPRYGRYVP